MSSVIIEINLDNDAFLDPVELARILHKAATHCEGTFVEDLTDLTLRDINGNRVGEMTFDIDQEDKPDPGVEQERDRISQFVRLMQFADIRSVLENACGIQTYDHESRGLLSAALVESVMDGDITTDDISSFFGGVY